MSSLQNALRILSSLQDSRPVLRVTGLSEQLNIPKSSVSRLLREMVEARIIERDAGGRGFRAGPELLRLGTLYKSRFPLDTVLGDELSALVSAFPATAYVGVLDGIDLVIMRRIEGPYPVRFILEPGSRSPAWETAVGRILLARRLADEIGPRLPERMVNPQRGFDISREEMVAELAQARASGYTRIDHRPLGIEAYAVGFADMNGRDLGIALCFGRDSMTTERKDEALGALLSLARKMAMALGEVQGSK